MTVASSLHRPGAAGAGSEAAIRGGYMDRLVRVRDAQAFLGKLADWYTRNTNSGWICPPEELTDDDLRELRLLRGAVRSLLEGDLEHYRNATRELGRRHPYQLALEGHLLSQETGWHGFIASLIPTLIRLNGHRARLRQCANPECGWVILDRSPTGRRRWCEMKACGNRAKVRRFRARARRGR